MKKLIILLIAISLSLSTKAQDTVTIPDSIAALVIDDLIQLDGLRYELNRKDSIIVVYADRIMNKDSVIQTHILKENEYKNIITNLDKINQTLIEDKRQLKREIRKDKINNILNKALIIGEALMVIVLATLLIAA